MPAFFDKLIQGWQTAQRWLPTLALAAMVVASAWLLHRLDPDALSSTPDGRHDPDFFMEDFHSSTMDEMGKPKHTIEATKLVHYPDTDTNELTRPYLLVFHPKRPPWHVRSERGWISTTGEVVLLLGNVHAWRNDEEGQRDIDIRTRDLRVLPETNYGETDKPVVIRTPTSESRGVGLRAFMEEDRIELLSRVSTIYEKRCSDGSSGSRADEATCRVSP